MAELNRTDQARQAGAAWMLDDYPDGTGSGSHCEFLPVDMLDAFMAGVRWADDHQAAAELPNPTPPRPPCVGHVHGPDGCTECKCTLPGPAACGECGSYLAYSHGEGCSQAIRVGG